MAPKYVSKDVKQLRESDNSTQVTLLLGASTDREILAENAEDIGATVDARLGRATLRISAPEFLVDELCEIDELKSIELEHQDVQTLGREEKGNGRSLPLLTR